MTTLSNERRWDIFLARPQVLATLVSQVAELLAVLREPGCGIAFAGVLASNGELVESTEAIDEGGSRADGAAMLTLHRIASTWRLEQILSKPSNERTAEHVERVRGALRRSVSAASFPDEVQWAMAREASLTEPGQGETIYRRGEVDFGFFVVLRGAVDLIIPSSKNRRGLDKSDVHAKSLLLRTIKAGSAFGELSLVAEESSAHDAVVRSEGTSLLALTRSAVAKALRAAELWKVSTLLETTPSDRTDADVARLGLFFEREFAWFRAISSGESETGVSVHTLSVGGGLREAVLRELVLQELPRQGVELWAVGALASFAYLPLTAEIAGRFSPVQAPRVARRGARRTSSSASDVQSFCRTTSSGSRIASSASSEDGTAKWAEGAQPGCGPPGASRRLQLLDSEGPSSRKREARDEPQRSMGEWSDDLHRPGGGERPGAGECGTLLRGPLRLLGPDDEMSSRPAVSCWPAEGELQVGKAPTAPRARGLALSVEIDGTEASTIQAEEVERVFSCGDVVGEEALANRGGRASFRVSTCRVSAPGLVACLSRVNFAAAIQAAAAERATAHRRMLGRALQLLGQNCNESGQDGSEGGSSEFGVAVDEESALRLAGLFVARRLAAGEVIGRQGEAVREVIVVLDGSVASDIAVRVVRRHSAAKGQQPASRREKDRLRYPREFWRRMALPAIGPGEACGLMDHWMQLPSGGYTDRGASRFLATYTATCKTRALAAPLRRILDILPAGAAHVSQALAAVRAAARGKLITRALAPGGALAVVEQGGALSPRRGEELELAQGGGDAAAALLYHQHHIPSAREIAKKAERAQREERGARLLADPKFLGTRLASERAAHATPDPPLDPRLQPSRGAKVARAANLAALSKQLPHKASALQEPEPKPLGPRLEQFFACLILALRRLPQRSSSGITPGPDESLLGRNPAQGASRGASSQCRVEVPHSPSPKVRLG